jgi:hypothetical protein
MKTCRVLFFCALVLSGPNWIVAPFAQAYPAVVTLTTDSGSPDVVDSGGVLHVQVQCIPGGSSSSNGGARIRVVESPVSRASSWGSPILLESCRLSAVFARACGWISPPFVGTVRLLLQN